MQPLVTAFKKWYASASKQKKVLAGVGVFSLLCTGVLLSLSGSSSAQSDTLDTSPLYMLGVFVKLIGVLLLIVGAAIVLRRWQKNHVSNSYGRQLNLIETVRLSPKQALHLVKVGDQHLLIGATDTAVSLISPVQINVQSASVQAASADAVAPQPMLDFATLLGSLNSTQTTTISPTLDGDYSGTN